MDEPGLRSAKLSTNCDIDYGFTVWRSLPESITFSGQESGVCEPILAGTDQKSLSLISRLYHPLENSIPCMYMHAAVSIEWSLIGGRSPGAFRRTHRPLSVLSIAIP